MDRLTGNLVIAGQTLEKIRVTRPLREQQTNQLENVHHKLSKILHLTPNPFLKMIQIDSKLYLNSDFEEINVEKLNPCVYSHIQTRNTASPFWLGGSVN